MKRRIFIGIVLLVLLLCTACGGKQKPKAGETREKAKPGAATVTTSATPSPSPSPTPSPTPTPDPLLQRSLSEIYEAEYTSYTDGIYHLTNIGPQAGWSMFGGSLRDGYVMIQYGTYVTEEPTAKYIVFPLLAPERAVTYLSIEDANDNVLGMNGAVFEINTTGKVTKRGQTDEQNQVWSCGDYLRLIGISNDNTVWVVNEDGLYGYNFETEKEVHFPDCFGDYDDRILAEEDGLIYFALHNRFGAQHIYVLDTESDIIGVQTEPYGNAEMYPGVINYKTRERFYTASPSDPESIACFDKLNKDESILRSSGNRMVTFWYESVGDDYLDVYRIVDIRNGGQVGRIDTDLFSDRYWTIDSSDFEDGILLFTAYGDDYSEDIYIYDTRAAVSVPSESYRPYSAESDYPNAAMLAKRIESEFPGIRVYFDEPGLEMFEGSYYLRPHDDENVLIDFMEEMERIFFEMPDGYLFELCGNGKEGIDVFVVGSFILESSTSIARPAGFARKSEPRLELALGANYVETLASTVYHETTHLTEYRIGEYEAEHNVAILEYWNEKLNSPDYPSLNQYVDDNGDMINDYAGTYSWDPANAWYLDAYSKSAPTEDRARTIEYLYLNYDWMFESPHLKDKARFLTAVLREVFPSVAVLEEPAPWEKIFGIVDFEEYREAVME